ncbi:gp58-like family protein [Leuconostoc mesenteroides]|uniref:gp58-like family protein n=1 Tax=Leuconostoc mesenteroides TaxID=1245 RepID=UPI001CBF9776|nr:gp58-like family protein [Leuconostoc mesenteroides]MBZ1533746.1 hypothetical protein [Leuconostoc mesenteroides]
MGNVAVYKKGTTNFFSQGLGLLSDVVSSNLTQTVSSTGNVEQKLEVEYPIDGYLVSELVEGAILRVSVSTDKSDYGVFEIVDTLKDDSGTITVYGDPYYNRILRMSFDNGGVFTKFSSVQSALNAAKQNSTGFPADFNLISNLSTSVNLSENTYDTFGTFLEALNSAVHGNIKYSLNSIQIYSALGKDITDITLRDDMNTSSVKITTDFSGIINKVIPVLPVLDKDGNATDQTKVGTIVTSKYSNQFLDYWAGKVIQFDTQGLANTYFDRTNADRPVQTVDVDPIGLDDDFSTINIFDTIELYSTRLDYTDKLRVSERVFDTLAENVASFKLGSSSVNIFNQINEQNNEIFNNVVKLTNAAISANGKGIDYFGQAQPSSPKEGDTWFWDDGTDFGIKQYTNGEWVDLAGSNTAEKIATAVDDAVAQAKAHTDEVKQGLSSDIATAKSQATSQANSALASAKSAATSQFTQAQNALSDAKTDLTKSISSEASKAVAAANSQAQTYANQAKADVMSAASSADGVIRTAISSSANSLSATITQNKSSADSGISTAQTTAQAAVDGLTLKVSKTVYDKKTGELSSNINDVKDTADRSAQTIADIQESDGKRDSRISEVEKTAGEIKSTVSDLSIEQGKQSGYISTLKQRADGFEGSIRDINNVVNGLGQTNQLMNTEFTPDFQSWTQVSTAYRTTGNTKNGSNVVKVVADDGDYLYQDVAVSAGVVSFSSIMEVDDGLSGSFRFCINFRDSNHNYVSAGGTTWGTNNTGALGYTLQKVENIAVPSGAAYVRINYQFRGTGVARFLQPMLVFESTVGAYVQGNYNNNDALAKVKLTADEASAALTKLTNADGIITKAQADIQANADAITQKVSKTVYDKNTGDLTQAISKAQSTADGAVSTVGNYQTSNDKRVGAAETKISQNTDAINLRATKTDLDSAKNDYTAKISQVNIDINGIESSVSDIQGKVNSLGQTNQLFNTEFSPDFEGWSQVSTAYRTTGNTRYGSNVVKVVNDDGDYLYQDVPVGSGSVSFSTFMQVDDGINGNFRFIINFRDSDHKYISSAGNSWGPNNTAYLNYTLQKLENIPVPAGAAFVRVQFQFRGTGVARFLQPMLVFNSTVGSYVQGNYNNNAALAQVKITADSISNFVRDSSGNISSNFQTALSKTSIITGSTLATSIQTQTSSQISSAITDNNGKIISLINQDTSGVQIAGKNIVLNGDTTVTGDFYAKGGNFTNLNASNITVGTLNGNQVNITNLNASNIVSGAISGANLNIDLNTGQVQFQKGRIFKSDYTTDINIDQGYISTADSNTRVLLKGGQMQFVAPNVFDLQNTPYLKVYNGTGGNSFAGANLSGRDYIALYNSANVSNVFDAPVGTESFSGISTGQASTGKWAPTKVGGADRGVIISGGRTDGWLIVERSPYIFVGSDANGTSAYGNRVYVHADYFHVPTVYSHGGSTGANVYVASDGALLKSSSATKYKTNIEHETDSIQGDQLLTIDPATWNDKFESEQLEQYHEIGVEPERQINMEGKRYYGIIAEDLVKAGLEELVTRNEETNEVEGVEYSKIGVALIPIVRDLRNKLNEQAVEIERLKDKNK